MSLEWLLALRIWTEDVRLYALLQKKGTNRDSMWRSRDGKVGSLPLPMVVDISAMPSCPLSLPFSLIRTPLPSFHCTRCLPNDIMLPASVKRKGKRVFYRGKGKENSLRHCRKVKRESRVFVRCLRRPLDEPLRLNSRSLKTPLVRKPRSESLHTHTQKMESSSAPTPLLFFPLLIFFRVDAVLDRLQEVRDAEPLGPQPEMRQVELARGQRR